MGEHFGGRYHRGRTSGHDLLRPLEAIRQFKDGEFRGTYWGHGGIRHVVERSANQHGNSYSPMGWGAAVLAWMVHVTCDYFSEASLPIPGTSLIHENSSEHHIRAFVQNDLYGKGINLRHVTLQALAPLAVEVGIRTYTYLRHRKSDAPKDAIRQKQRELLVLAHTLMTAVNLGKIVITHNPLMLNVPALLALVRAVMGLIVLEEGRNSFIAKVSRNVAELRDSQDEIEQMLVERFPIPVLLS